MKRALSELFALFLVVTAGTAIAQDSDIQPSRPRPTDAGSPTAISMKRAGSTSIDLRALPTRPLRRRDRPEREEPDVVPVPLPGGAPEIAATVVPGRNAPMPNPIANFIGLDFLNWGAGRPPDTVGDVGPTHFIQAVNTSIGIFQKSDGTRLAAFTYDTFMSQGNFGNLCDTDNFGDPVVLYDSFEDRWVITDFAFQLDASQNIVSPPGVFQCFAVSKSGDPVAGGWNFYSLHVTDALNDYPKFGVWPDGIYMAANMFAFPAGGAFQGTRVWAFNKAQMYAGAPTVQILTFNPPGNEFTLLPSNARLQAGTPPAGTPNYFSTVFNFTNAVSTYKFHVDWDRISLSTFTGPFITIAPASWISPPSTVPAQGGNNNDTLAVRLMMQNQYTNLGGVESLWATHTIRNPTTAGVSAVRYYQTTVTGGTIAANTTQAATHAPDTTNRYMPSLAVDRTGNMAVGYSASTAALFPAIRYAGRFAGDALNTLPQTETSLIEGTGSQNTSTRWGDYSGMSLDPNGCTFWHTNEYFITTGNNWQTRVGSFTFAPANCTTVASGTLQGTVTATAGGAPIVGATLTFGSRTATTDGSGFYSFASVPSGTYPSITASAPGYNSSTATAIVVTDGNTTAQDFSLATAPTSGCLTDTAQADFQTGVPSNTDLTASPGDVVLASPSPIDQQNTAGTNTGTGFGTPAWTGMTFIPAVTGQLVKADVQLFCNACTGTPPNLTLSVRATSGGLPTGADLASTTIPGSTYAGGAAPTFTATFGSPATLTSGTQYALILRPVSVPVPAGSGYFWIRSSPSTYANGQRVLSPDSGATWSADSTRDYNFKTYMNNGFAASGTLVSGTKDSNPASGYYPMWTTLSWNASLPPNTAVSFQVAASNSAIGPFNFVGPDGTAGTSFTTSGASLSQFNGNRYLKYTAFLSTTDSTATPTVNDVTVCFFVVAPDLAITKTDGVTTATPGGSVTYTITASNAGPGGSTGATVADTFPASLTCTWTCAGAGGGTCTASGAGNIGDTVNLPAGGSVTYTASCAISAFATGTLSNTATVAPPTGVTDPNPGNNSATDTDTLTPQADLAITKTDGVTTATPGGSVTYTITASNAGPSNATGATVSDTFPAPLTCTWTCVGAGGGTCTAAGAGNINNLVNLPAGGSVTYTASCTISASATGTLSNTAVVVAPGGVADFNPGNNAATDTDTLAPQADLGITKTDGVTAAAPGGSVTYTITASNAGPSNATGATVSDTFPAPLTCTWTCVGAGGGTCTAAGAGNINNLVNLPSGGSVTYTASCTISPSATGTLSNTAVVAPPGGVTDFNPGNNAATDTDTLGPTADLSINKTDGVTTAMPGGSVTYTITASNAGPSNATGATVTDNFPASLTCTWTCAGAGGGTCTASGSGNINDVVNLPAGGSVTHTASCAISLGATGTLSNTATVAPPGGVTDPTPGNNSATDTDTLLAVNGFFAITPCRFLDTRDPDGPYGGPALAALATRTVVANGQCNIPPNTKAITINITVTQATASGDLVIYQSGIVPPTFPIIYYKAAQTRANNGILALGAGDDFVIKSDQVTGTVHVIIDVTGYIQ